tara:strand:+ start:6257 stop:7042 length:786 start_codon:yes stop_codon:yes gene_type:complete
MISLIDAKEYLLSKEFQEEYKIYLHQNKSKGKLNDFINSIELNKKYYRLCIHKNKKFKKPITDDTAKIKEITSLINKITNKNYETIKEKIIQKIDIDHIKPFIYQKLLDSSIIDHIYIHLYVGIIKEINLDNRNDLILKLCEKYYNDFFKSCIQKEGETNYEHLCMMNKNIDNIIGFSLLISYLEKEDIIDGFIDKVIDSYMHGIMDLSETELYKLLVSFENISEIHYRIIPDKYQKILEKIRKKTGSSKIRFKIMDILKV